MRATSSIYGLGFESAPAGSNPSSRSELGGPLGTQVSIIIIYCYAFFRIIILNRAGRAFGNASLHIHFATHVDTLPSLAAGRRLLPLLARLPRRRGTPAQVRPEAAGLPAKARPGLRSAVRGRPVRVCGHQGGLIFRRLGVDQQRESVRDDTAKQITDIPTSLSVLREHPRRHCEQPDESTTHSLREARLRGLRLPQ